MKRSTWAVVAGFLLIAMLSVGSGAMVHAMYPRLFDATGGTSNLVVLCLTTVCIGVFAIVGCYLTARLAPSHPMRHALILGLLGLIVNLFGTMKMWNMYPAWYNVLNLLLVMPYAWLGGRLREN